jgi:2-oxoisovalerate dehydrogenase E2 component (dihydrolipoyl transacylase)
VGLYAIRLPDVGEGVAEAEIVEWHVKVGDPVRQDDVIVAVMTDKATVEIPSVVSGTVVWLGGQVGDKLAVGSDLVRLEVAGEGNVAAEPAARVAQTIAPAKPASRPPPRALSEPSSPATSATAARTAPATPAHAPSPAPRRLPSGEKPTAAPSVRRRAREAGIDLRAVAGSGPAGRITHEDLDAHLSRGRATANGARRKDTSVKEIKIVGLRRKIAERMALANSRIPHITIVEEVDMTHLEGLREELNSPRGEQEGRLTLLPFLIRAIVSAVREQPQFNAHFDDEAGVITQFGGVHVGIATQTPSGLMVPVVRHAEANSLWDNAREIARLAGAAREASAERGELSGSTITITSLGPLGGVATTPIINRPEVAIIGVNKMSIRPWWDGQQFVPRKMMNISSSFDHRVIDGYDAALFVQKLKTLLEKPAMLFVEGWPDA